MRLRVVGNIGAGVEALLEEEVTEISRALRAAVTRSAGALQRDFRDGTRAAGLGEGLARAWRAEIYPRVTRRTLRPAGLVYSKATALHAAFSEGAVVLPRVGTFLLIPSAAAERIPDATSTTRARGGGSVPGGMRRRRSSLQAAAEYLRVPIVSAAPRGNGAKRDGTRRDPARGYILLTPAGRGRSTLVALYYSARGAVPVPLFTLVRQTRLPKLLNIEAAAERARADFTTATRAALAER